MRERDLTPEERMTWGECPVCDAVDGQPCAADVGVQFGVRLDGRRMKDGEGAHLGRLQKAPKRIREVGCG